MYYVYVLRSEKVGKFYIGSTSDVNARLDFHNSGKQRSTRHRIPFKIVYTEKYVDKSDAIKREKQIKSYKGGEAFKRLISGM